MVLCSNFELSRVTMTHRLSRLDAGTGRGVSAKHWGSLGDMRLFKRRQPSFDFSKFKETWHQQNVGGIEAVQLYSSVLSNLVSCCWSFSACRSLRWSSSKQKRQRSREQRPKRGSSTAVLSKSLLRNSHVLHVYVPDYATIYVTTVTIHAIYIYIERYTYICL